ncbi:MAG: group II intron maturase-specific domain-containing protein [Enterocloster clostridioformis]
MYKVQKLNELIRGWINYYKIGSMKTNLCKGWTEAFGIAYACVYGNIGKLHKTEQGT